MELISVAVQGEDAPAAVLGQVAVGGDSWPAALAELAALPQLDEVVLLSTCHRTEVYAVAVTDSATEAVEQWFERRGGAAVRTYLRRTDGSMAAQALFEVAAGLRSPVLGDRDVLGQVRGAWKAATAAGAASAGMDLLFRHAIAAARRVRGETGLGRAGDSVAAVVSGLVSRWLPQHDGTVLVVGAGALGAGIVGAIRKTGDVRLLIANRSIERARQLAERVGGTAVGLDGLNWALGEADATCYAVGPPRPLLDVAGATQAMSGRSRPLLVVDVGTPRAVEPEVSLVDGLRRLDLADVRRMASRAGPSRLGDVYRAEQIVGEELARYEEARRCRHAAPALAALHRWAEEVRTSEVQRTVGRLEGLTAEQAAAVDALTRRLTARLLHAPSACLRLAASAQQDEWIAGVASEILGSSR